MQARVNRAEHHHALLDESQGCANRRVGILVRQFFKRGLNHAFARVDQKAKQLKQRWAGSVERNWHGQLANVVDQSASLDLDHFGRLQVEGLPAGAAFELQKRWDVLDVSRVQQCTQRAGGCARQAANHVGQANRVSAAPWHERELNNPFQLLAAVFLWLPVTVQA